MPSAEDLAFPLYSALSNFISWFVVSGRRDKITSIAMYICPLSTVAEVSEFECDKLLDDIKATKKDTA
ncbi:hypothetical protein CMV_025867 [Castanea mollissima]|uniref:Uncharacterized protein n=1 Tax=Castanea mollissima TaxID=60419 RepID=A0A8J4VGG6_9ROSI|nr:hypothetical protein CMV_025867 [Castanea mollissima]